MSGPGSRHRRARGQWQGERPPAVARLPWFAAQEAARAAEQPLATVGLESYRLTWLAQPLGRCLVQADGMFDMRARVRFRFNNLTFYSKVSKGCQTSLALGLGRRLYI